MDLHFFGCSWECKKSLYITRREDNRTSLLPQFRDMRGCPTEYYSSNIYFVLLISPSFVRHAFVCRQDGVFSGVYLNSIHYSSIRPSYLPLTMTTSAAIPASPYASANVLPITLLTYFIITLLFFLEIITNNSLCRM